MDRNPIIEEEAASGVLHAQEIKFENAALALPLQCHSAF